VKGENQCYIPEAVGPLPYGITPRCTPCQTSQSRCSWADHIPRRLYHLKYAIITDRSIPAGVADPTDPDTLGEASHPLVFSPENLGRLLRATETAISEVDVRVQEMVIEERLRLCEGLEELYSS